MKQTLYRKTNEKWEIVSLDSYLETYHQVALCMERQLQIEGSKVTQEYMVGGTGYIWEETKRLTDKFEELHNGREWDGDWFDTLEDFLYENLKQ